MPLRHFLLRQLFAMPRIAGRDALVGLIAKTYLTRPTRLADGLLMDLDASEWIQLEILVRGETEPSTMLRIRRLVEAGDVVFDVGAHVGHHSLTAAQAAGPAGRVFAFDPQPYNADRITRNAILNKLPTICVVCAAASDSDGHVRLPVQNPRDRARLSMAAPGPNDSEYFHEVASLRLDSFMDAHAIGRVKLLKIDVEGYECEVLQGLGRRLCDCQNIILEILSDADVEKTRRIIDLLSTAGFAVCDLAGSPWAIGGDLPERNIWAVKR